MQGWRLTLPLLLPGLGVSAFGASVAAASGPPPRATDPIVLPAETSTLAAALTIDLGDLERTLERTVPQRLWEIHEDDAQCVAPQTVDLAVVALTSPKITCDIDGVVTRGRLRVAGRGRELVVTLPVSATLRADDVAGLLRGKTATGAADLRIAVQLDLSRDWRLTGTPRLAYQWSRAPGIDFLGQRITFTAQADREIAKLRGQIERTLAAELARVPLRDAAERGWRAGHAVIALNRESPAVWARLTPERVRYGGYRIEGRKLIALLGIDARVETRLGQPPAAPMPAPLPPLATLAADTPGRARLHLPIIADYAVLEPVIAAALAQRAAQPFALGEVGTVTARFGKVTVYGTDRNRIAVGVDFAATSDIALAPQASGTIWLTARPVTQPNSREVSFTDIAVSGDTTLQSEALLLGLANAPEFQTVIAEALRQNFEAEFAALLARINRAVAQRQDGPLSYRVQIDKVTTGTISAHGEGLYLPVEVEARIAADTLRLP